MAGARRMAGDLALHFSISSSIVAGGDPPPKKPRWAFQEVACWKSGASDTVETLAARVVGSHPAIRHGAFGAHPR